MYKILIVEDEPLERESLSRILSEHSEMCFEISSSDNGEDALEIALNEQIDIILMDIHLGSTNGLDIAKSILAEGLLPKIIMLTAYDQFSYAQTAVKIGVSDYLLKPVKTEELFLAINKQIKIIEEEEYATKENAKAKANLEVLRDVFRENLAGYVINDLVHIGFSSMLSTLSINFKSTIIFVVGFSSTNFEFDAKESAVVRQMMIDLLKKELENYTAFYDYLNSPYVTILLVNSPEGLKENDFMIPNRIRSVLTKAFHLSIKMGVSGSVHDLFQLPQAFKQAELAYKIGENWINHYSDYLESKLIHIYPAEYEHRLEAALLKNFEQELEQVLYNLSKLLFIANSKVEETKNSCIQLFLNTLSNLKSKVSFKDFSFERYLSDSIIAFIQSTTVSSLQKTFSNAILDLYQRIQSVLSSRNRHLVARITDYIERNYNTDISLNGISAKLRISPYYLSRTFKSETGINIIDFLTNVRINHSKELLRSSDYSVKEISAMVGMLDANYFCKVFRKRTGITPSEFKTANK